LYNLIVNKYATYYEIRELLDVWEVLDLIEIMVVCDSNINLSYNDNINKN
jgi:hypothetical protein